MKQCERCGMWIVEGQSCYCENLCDSHQPNIEKRSVKSYLGYTIYTAIYYPIIYCLCGLFINLTLGKSLIGFILPIFLANAASISIVVGGFYFFGVTLTIYVNLAAGETDGVGIICSGSINTSLPKPLKVILWIVANLSIIASVFTGFL